jgi:hypothetical protein
MYRFTPANGFGAGFWAGVRTVAAADAAAVLAVWSDGAAVPVHAAAPRDKTTAVTVSARRVRFIGESSRRLLFR